MQNASNSGRPEGCLSPREFAQRAGLSKSTVDRYLRKGLLAKVQLGKGYRVWIPESELYSTMRCPTSPGSSGSDGRAQESKHEEKAAKPLPGKNPAWMNRLHHTNKGGSDAQE